MSLFTAVEMAPRDPILGLNEQFAADTNPNKVNLGVGVYFDDNGKLPLLECVQAAEKAMMDKPSARGYLPIDVLADVAGEDGDEEHARNETHVRPTRTGQQQRHAETDLHQTRQHHHQVLVHRHPVGNLRLELEALGGQVGDTGQRQCHSQHHPGNGSGPHLSPASR